MITVQILEPSDTLRPDDWCRPLSLISMSGGHSDHYSFESCYSGAPENNVQWVKVREVFGECWYGRTVGELLRSVGLPYEFCRGDLPEKHTMKSKRELAAKQARKDLVLDHTPLTFGKHKGKTTTELLTQDPKYLVWLDVNVPHVVSETIRLS